jgi:hypothetical protein
MLAHVFRFGLRALGRADFSLPTLAQEVSWRLRDTKRGQIEICPTQNEREAVCDLPPIHFTDL